MNFFLYVILILNFSFSEEIEKIDRLPSLGEEKLTINLGLDELFNFNTILDTILTEFNIQDIKNKTRGFIPSPVNKDDVVLMKTSFGEIIIKLSAVLLLKRLKEDL